MISKMPTFIIIIIITFLISVQLQGHHPHQWPPKKVSNQTVLRGKCSILRSSIFFFKMKIKSQNACQNFSTKYLIMSDAGGIK